MANLRLKTDRYAIVEVRIPRQDFDRLTTFYASEGQGLQALRLAMPGLLTVLLERRTRELEAREREAHQLRDDVGICPF